MSESTYDFESDSVFLVTGGAGFIGSNLCESILNLGYQVRCLDNLSTGKKANIEMFLKHPHYKFIEGDITDIATCITATKGVNYVLHQAAWGSVPRSIEQPLYYEKVNINGTLNMMEASRINNVKKFIYASSSSVYGDSTMLPKKEGQEGNVLSPYALTKRTNEEYGKLYFTLYNLETYGLRYFNVFGKRQDPDGPYAAVIPKFVRYLLNGEAPVIHGDGTQSRDFTYISNVVDANLRACLAPSSSAGNVYNIAGGEREYLIDVYYEISKLLNVQIPPIFAESRKGDIKHSNADITKAKIKINYVPQYDFKTGIQLALKWYVDNL